MSLLGAEQYFAGCLWIDCCGCHQCTYRFEHRLRTLEMRVDFCIFAVSSSETCVVFLSFWVSCIIILINWWYYWCLFSSEFHEIFLLTLIIVYFEHISNSPISQTFNQSVFLSAEKAMLFLNNLDLEDSFMDSDSASSLNFNSIIQAINDARAASAGRRLSDSGGELWCHTAVVFFP